MRLIVMVKATSDIEAGAMPKDGSVMAAMAAYHEELTRAGVLLDAAGLQPSVKGWKVRFGAGGERRIVDGPFAETREPIAGYTLIRVRSREEAIEWARRFPAPMGDGVEAEIEVRQLCELDDFTPGDSVDRFCEMEAARH